MSDATYYLVTPARRGRTGFRSRTHLALPEGRKKLPRSLCKAENNTPEMREPLVMEPGTWGQVDPPYTLDALEGLSLSLGSKTLCKNCLKLARRRDDT